MKITRSGLLLLFVLGCIGAGCANIVPPSGGEKDETPPKLLKITPRDSLLNTRVTRIEMTFDEFIEVRDANKEITVSPLLQTPPVVVNVGKRVTVRIADSLLDENTTYRVQFGNAIKDLHEANPFSGYSYLFSTGSYFDSLRLRGFVYNAATGLADSGSRVVLYPASKSDSAVVKERPRYVSSVGAGGLFSFEGLPQKPFRIYALRDMNDNLIFDGGEEAIAFIDSVVIPADSIFRPVVLNIFKEVVDTTSADSTDMADSASTKPAAGRPGASGGISRKRKQQASEDDVFGYTVGVDTGSTRKGTFDITKPLIISFNKEVDTLDKGRITLSYDSLENDLRVEFTIAHDSVVQERLVLHTNWRENKMYTLRLLKGFAKDTSGADAMPSKHIFRTKEDADYSRLHVHLPAKYLGEEYLLMIKAGEDTIYNKPVTDTMIHLQKLQPGEYHLRIIVDKNKNGQWDTGDLLQKLQPEEVIPYMLPVQLKAGWEHTIDFEKEEKQPPVFNTSPGGRDKPPVRK